jgi:transcription elongation GreA/GreB family factor
MIFLLSKTSGCFHLAPNKTTAAMKPVSDTIDRALLKKQILEEGIKQHQSVIDDFAQSIKELLAANGNGQPATEEAVQRANQIADQLEFAREEMLTLQDMQRNIETIHSQVQLGSVVVTDKDTFFVSVSIERFYVGDLKVFGLSTKTPLYRAMEGKKKGDTFSYGGIQYRIEDVF